MLPEMRECVHEPEATFVFGSLLRWRRCDDTGLRYVLRLVALPRGSWSDFGLPPGNEELCLDFVFVWFHNRQLSLSF